MMYKGSLSARPHYEQDGEKTDIKISEGEELSMTTNEEVDEQVNILLSSFIHQNTGTWDFIRRLVSIYVENADEKERNSEVYRMMAETMSGNHPARDGQLKLLSLYRYILHKKRSLIY